MDTFSSFKRNTAAFEAWLNHVTGPAQLKKTPFDKKKKKQIAALSF